MATLPWEDYKAKDPNGPWNDFQQTSSASTEEPSLAKQAGDAAMTIPNELNNISKGLLGNMKAGLYDIPKALIKLPIEVAKGTAPRDTSLGKFTEESAKGLSQTIQDIESHPIDAMTQNPITTATSIMGLPFGEMRAGLEGAVTNFGESLAKDSTLAKFNKVLGKIPENATKMEGYKITPPTPEELSTATNAVIKAHQSVIDDVGGKLNEAKSEAGLPTTQQEIDFSDRKFGNKYNLDTNKPLELPERYSKKAPVMEEAPVGPIEKGDIVEATGPNGEKVKLKFTMPEGMLKGSNDPAFDLKDPVKNPNKDWSHPVDSTLSKSTLESYGYKIPMEKPMLEAPETTKPMPYSIGDWSDAKGLRTEINRFLSNQDYISAKDKIKAASFFQEEANKYIKGQYGETATGNATNSAVDIGRLKGLHSDLADVIDKASPQLQEAKTGWASMKKSLNLVSDQLDSTRPGKAQDFLRKLFTSNKADAQDRLKQLMTLEKMSGQPVVTELFKKFAGESFDKILSRHFQGTEAIGAGASMAAGHPIGAAVLGTAAALQSPKLIGLAENAASKLPEALSKRAPTGFRMFSTPDMQSLRDRLRNNDNNAK